MTGNPAYMTLSEQAEFNRESLDSPIPKSLMQRIDECDDPKARLREIAELMVSEREAINLSPEPTKRRSVAFTMLCGLINDIE